MGRKRSYNQNKKEERIILDYFSASYQDFPAGKITESESPDFIISPAPKKKIGLELTRLTRSNPENKKHNFAKIDSLEKVICERAKIMFESEFKIPLYVNIYFKEGIQLSKLNIDNYAELIASDIYEKVNELDRKRKLQLEINSTAVDEILNLITVNYFPEVKNGFWDNTGAYMLPELTRDLLQQTILSKEEKLQLYQRNLCDEYWLLIYSDSVRKSTAFNISNQIEKWNISSEFDRVFLFEVMDFKIYHITCKT